MVRAPKIRVSPNNDIMPVMLINNLKANILKLEITKSGVGSIEPHLFLVLCGAVQPPRASVFNATTCAYFGSLFY